MGVLVRRVVLVVGCVALSGVASVVASAAGSTGPASSRAQALPVVELQSWRELRTWGEVTELDADGPVVVGFVKGRKTGCQRVFAWGPSRWRVVYLANACWLYRNLSITGTRVRFSYGGDCHNAGCPQQFHRITDALRPGVVRAAKQEGPDGEEISDTRRGVSFDTMGILEGMPYWIRLRRLSDGRVRVIRVPGREGVESAALEDVGLFYTYTRTRGPHPGRVVFIPFNELFPG